MATLLKRHQTPISRYAMFSGALVAAVLMTSVACSTPADTEAAPAEVVEEAPVPGIWPPPASPAIDQNAKVAELGADPENIEFCGDSMVFDDRRMVAAAAGYERVGYIVCDGEFELPYNIFDIQEPGDGFVNNYFEVTAFDNGHTRIKLDDSKNQGVVLEVDRDARYAGKVAYKPTANYVGTRLIYADHVYELGPEGWTVEGKLVHSFPEAP
jgi:hypothetical protein